MLHRLGFGLLVALVLGLLALNALAWTGGLVDEAPPPARGQVPASMAPTGQPAASETSDRSRSKPIALERAAKPRQDATISSR